MNIPENVTYDAQGLVPVVVQDAASGDVLMLAYANAEALQQTVETGLLHFWSRSRQQLWCKGATSGNIMRVREMRKDCDGDALLALVDPAGPACHTGTPTCFGQGTDSELAVLAELARVISARRDADPSTSYTARLLSGGLDRGLKKMGEEATEVLLAAKGEDDRRLAEESADLVFHLLVVLEQRGVALADVLGVLRERRRAGQ